MNSRRAPDGLRPASTSGDQFHRQSHHIRIAGDSRLPFDESPWSSRGSGSRGRGRNSPAVGDNSTNYRNENHKSAIYVRKNLVPEVEESPHRRLQREKGYNDSKKGIISSGPPEQPRAMDVKHNNDQLTKTASEDIVSRDMLFASGEANVEARKDAMGPPVTLALKFETIALAEPHVCSMSSDKDVNPDETEIRNTTKSGGLGGSASREDMKPFDIFLPKTGTGIKLECSLYAQNREKRNAMKRYSESQNGRVLRPGMVLLKNFLSITEQVKIAGICRRLGLGQGGFYQPGYRDGSVLHLRMMCLGKHWNPETGQYGDSRPKDGAVPPAIPNEFILSVQSAIRESQAIIARQSNHIKANSELLSMSPDLCLVNFYSSTGRLGLHQDKDESEESLRKGVPIVSFSIGDSAEFLYSDQKDVDNADKVMLESGDVLLFGGKSRRVFHGVRTIIPNTAPKALLDETNLRKGRLNLTFRQY